MWHCTTRKVGKRIAGWLVIAACLHAHNVWACTVFVVVRDGQVLFCNNEDYNQVGHIWFVPASPGKFGRVNLGFNDRFAQGSMNERGLAFDSTALPPVPWTADPDLETPSNLIEKIMNECQTVAESLHYFASYNCRHLAKGQFLFADAGGDAAVVSWLPDTGLSITRIATDPLLITNSRLQASGYRCQRFVRAERQIAACTTFDVDTLAGVLETVHQRGPGGFTSYSNIFDLKAGKIHLYNLANFDERIELDLSEQLARGDTRSVPLAELFTHSPRLGEIRAGEQRADWNTRIQLPDEVLQRYVGFYRPEENANVELQVTLGDGVLWVHNPGQPPAELFPEAETLFRVAPDRGQVSFVLDSERTGRVVGMVLHKQRDMKAIRK